MNLKKINLTTNNYPILKELRFKILIKEFHYSANIAQQIRDNKFMKPRFHKKFVSFIKLFNKNFNPHKTIE